MSLFKQPILQELEAAQSVLIAGAGGGFDVFSGLPLYFALRNAGKEVHMANLSFSNLLPTAGRWITPDVVEITPDSDGSTHYFPEKHLSEWFEKRGEKVPVYAFRNTGPAPVADAYKGLIDELGVDAIVLVDGGTDSLMRGDEHGLGTPIEDMTSIAAVHYLASPTVTRKILITLGFGIDAFHRVCHAHVLESVADLIRAGGYLGAFSLIKEMEEFELFRDATEYVISKTPSTPSIVCHSLISAIEGEFGDHHRTTRTAGSDLFINPLMALYWCFRLDEVAKRVLYLDAFRDAPNYIQAELRVQKFRVTMSHAIRPWKDLPM